MYIYSRGCPVQASLGPGFRWPHPHCRKDSSSLSPPRRPLRPNFHRSRIAAQIVTKTAPSPILGTLDHPALDRITVNIPKLLHELEAFSGRPSPLPKSRAEPRDLPKLRACQNESAARRASLRATPCFSDCIARASEPRSGSLTSRCACSGITT